MSNFNEPINKLNNKTFQDKLNAKWNNNFTLTGDYIKSNINSTFKCNTCGHEFIMRPAALMSRGRCPNCIKISKKKRKNTWNKMSNEDFINRIKLIVGDEYTPLSKYIDAAEYVRMRHNICGYTWEVKARSFMCPSTSTRCPFCAQHTSNKEKDLLRFVESIYRGNIIHQDKKQIAPYELDIYIPEKRVAIEFNGTYWHNDENKPINYHFEKSQKCEKKGIRLIHIWEYEWENERQRPILKNIIKSALGVNENRIYARKLDIEVRPSKDMKEFFNKNNIQGFRAGKFSICLVDKNTREVYMAYQMGHCYFGKGKYEWEVIRGATKLGYTVVGGASKIWKYFIDNYNPKSCVYYVDYNYFNGNSITYLGLKYITTQSSFKNFWVETGEVRNREPARHKEIKELQQKGLVISIHNAGTKVYVWTKE